MRRIELKTVPFTTDNGTEARLDYRAELRGLLRGPKRGTDGMDLDEMRKAIALLDKLDGDADVVLVEDEQHAFLVSRIDAMRWAVAHRVVLDFIDAVKNAPKVPVAVAEAAE